MTDGHPQACTRDGNRLICMDLGLLGPGEAHPASILGEVASLEKNLSDTYPEYF